MRTDGDKEEGLLNSGDKSGGAGRGVPVQVGGAKIPIRGRVMPTWRDEFRFVYVPIQTFTRWVRREVNK
jgi:hypothetical protein